MELFANVDLSTAADASHRLWLTLMFENKPGNYGLEWCRVTNENNMTSNFVTYTKISSADSANKLEEEMLNIDNDALLVHSFEWREIAEMVLNTHMREYSDDDEDDDDDCDDIVNTSTKISIEDTVKMSDQLTAGLEHPAFIGEQGIMAVCSTKDRLYRSQ